MSLSSIELFVDIFMMKHCYRLLCSMPAKSLAADVVPSESNSLWGWLSEEGSLNTACF